MWQPGRVRPQRVEYSVRSQRGWNCPRNMVASSTQKQRVGYYFQQTCNACIRCSGPMFVACIAHAMCRLQRYMWVKAACPLLPPPCSLAPTVRRPWLQPPVPALQQSVPPGLQQVGASWRTQCAARRRPGGDRNPPETQLQVMPRVVFCLSCLTSYHVRACACCARALSSCGHHHLAG